MLRDRNHSIVSKASRYITIIADIIIFLVIAAHTHLSLMYYDVFVTGTNLNDNRSPYFKEFTDMLLYRMQMSIVVPPTMLLCVGILNYLNSSFHRKGVKVGVGSMFITA